MMRLSLTEKPWFLALATVGLLAGGVLLSVSRLSSDHSLLCSLTPSATGDAGATTMSTQLLHLNTILHYATTSITPQQSKSEIRISLNVLVKVSPCNFLVFGLGHDSLMWSSFNPRGLTLFLEEDPKWLQSVLKDAPSLVAHTVRYPTRLSQADSLLAHSRSEPSCRPSAARIPGDGRCLLALRELPSLVYHKDWDLIMIDAPRGYAGDLPGRMAAIFSAAVMARNRKTGGVTHVFLHDIDRRVERLYADEFLCRKYRKAAVGRLWHFEIPSAVNSSRSPDSFCS